MKTAEAKEHSGLTRLRLLRGMSRKQVAAAVRVSPATVWAWERGQYRPTPDKLRPLAKALRITEADLIDLLFTK